MLASVLVAILGMIGALAFAIGAEAARAQNDADAVAHDVEAWLLELPPWTRDDLSGRIQGRPGSCSVFARSSAGFPTPDDDCRGLFAATERRLAIDSRGEAVLLGLVVSGDARDARNGRGPGRLEVVAFVALRRPIPGCGSAPPPEVGARDGCWAQAQAAAHAA
ncbi:MAG TPA: hypothetical protein VI316_07400 [Candidatus Dormibacteraeota bacterium]